MKALIALIALAMVADSASAQSKTEMETGSSIAVPRRARISDAVGLSHAESVRRVMADFAGCVIDREYRRVEQAVVLPVGDAFTRAVGKMVTPDCLAGGEIRFQPLALRGPVFKELYIRRAAAESNGRKWGPIVAKISLGREVTGSTSAETTHLALMEFGSCVVAQDAGAARRVVMAPTLSQAQNEAIQAVVPQLSACLPGGTTLSLNKQVIEGTLAEVLYRGVDAPPTVAAAASESK